MSSIDDVKSRLDIVDIVGGYVGLQKSGRSFKAACPFHNEKTPSFIVSPQRQSWRCFGACATGGDAISFVMRIENLDFGSALRRLADKVGVTLTQSGRADSDRHEGLYRINSTAARFYQDTLKSPEGQDALAYLESRGVDTETCAKFELGLSPSSTTGRDRLKSHLLALGIDEAQAVLAGLLRRADDGSTFDFFRGRLMFPIHDRRGRIAGFGARALDGSAPKYLNTAQTDIFNKRDTLYGLHLAGESINSKKTGIVVEGYMDVIAAHQHGYTNVVASMGTALTEHQVSQLKSLAKDFVLALDPDAAGQEATLRSLESSWRVFERQSVDGRRRSVGMLYQREPLRLRIAALPAGRDPDALIREDRREWERLTEEALPLLEYLIPAVAGRFDTSTGHGKAQVVETLFPVIASVENLFDQERYFRTLAQVLDVSEESLKASIGRLREGTARGSGADRKAPQPPDASAATPAGAEVPLEEFTLTLLLRRPELRELAVDFSPQCFHRAENREIFTRWQSSTRMDNLRESLDAPLKGHFDRLGERDLVPADTQESRLAVWQCLQRLERRHLQELQEGLLASEEAGVPPPREVESAIAEVNARLKELFSEPGR